MTSRLIVVDRSLPDTAGLIAQAPADADIAWIHPQDEGLVALAAQLEARRQPVDLLQVLSHGAPGVLSLGGSLLTRDSLEAHRDALSRIRARLAEDAEVQLYGCEVAAGTAGRALIEALADALDARVGAATSTVGLRDTGPDWSLDAATAALRQPTLAFPAYAGTLALISGGPGNDTLNSTAGVVDTMEGGLGNDTYLVNDLGDLVNEQVNAGIDQINSLVAAYTLSANVENGRILSAGAADLTGNALNNLLYAGSGDNVLDGGAGNDTVSYQFATAGVTVSLAAVGAQATGGSGSDTLVGIEHLTGSNFNDRLTGNAAANSLIGGLGADTLIGGDGSDFYEVDNVGDNVLETNTTLTNGGSDTVNSRLAAYTLGANIENGRILASGVANLTGNTLANTLISGTGDNVLDGGAGVDTASYTFASAAVSVSLAIAGAQATGSSGSDTLVSIENLTGSNFADTLTGNAAANILVGGLAADTMTGGDGSDTYEVDDAGDLVVETNASSATGGSDTVNSRLASYTLGANVENGRILATGVASLTGNTLGNILFSGAGDNTLDGGAGNDTASYFYAASAVTVSLAAAGAQATGGSGSDTLISIEHLTGSNFADTLTGNAAANSLIGGLGADTLIGGDGSDFYEVDNVGDNVLETNTTLTNGGSDTVNSRLAAYTLGANVENGRILASGVANLTGNTLANTLISGTGDNVLDGGAGVDTASYTFASAAVSVSLAIAGAQATGSSGSDTLVSIENLTGSNFADTLTGNAAANILVGGLAADTMTGGDGSDTYEVDDAGDLVVETNASATTGGSDTVNSRLASYTLGANVENGRILATGVASLTGNTLGNILFSGAGDNTLDGGAGNDTASYFYAASAVTVSLAAAGAQATGGSGSDTLVAVESLTGSNFNDTLTGNAAANALIGGLGADTLTGGDGGDFYEVDNIGDLVVETNASSATGGVDTVNSRLTSYTLGSNIENGRILSTGAASLTGNDLANQLTGGLGANTLNGGLGNDSLIGGGNDTLNGGDGNDTYTLDVAGDLVVESTATAAGGTDTVVSTLASYTLTANVERLTLGGSGNINGTGNELANLLTGNAGANVLDGGLGNDTLVGGGDDTLIGGAGNDTYILTTEPGALFAYSDTGGIDTLQAGFGPLIDISEPNPVNEVLENVILTGTIAIQVNGNSLNNNITGNAANNVIDGATGNDTLDGGAGNDSILGGAGADLIVGGLGFDTIDGGVITDLVLNNDLNTVSYAGSTSGIQADLALGQILDGFGSADTVVNVSSIIGSAFTDIMRGTAENRIELFEGGLGNDYFDGGAITIGNSNNRIVYLNSPGAVTVNLGLGTATGASGNDRFININQVRGSAFADTLTGSNATAYTEQLEGRGGNDTLDGAGGIDLVRYDAASGAVNVNLATNSASGASEGVDTLLNIEGIRGSAFGDTLTGGATANGTGSTDGFEFFIGNGGNDTINGGAGYDRVDYSTTTNPGGVTVQLNWNGIGTAADGFGGTDSLIDIEAVRGSAFGDRLFGSDTSLAANPADNFESFEGREGVDLIDGGGGFDRADYQGALAGIGVDLLLNTAFSDGYGASDTLLNIEGVRGSDFDDSIRGNDLANTLQGGDGDDVLLGEGGNDSLEGGAGSDDLNGGAGNDTLVGGASTAIVLGDGNALSGGAGNDRLVGTGGTSFALYLDSTAAVTVNLVTGTASDGLGGTDTLVDMAGAAGSAFNDLLTGNALDNFFGGADGNDTIDGGAGFDLVFFDVGDALVGPVTASLAVGLASGTGLGTDTLLNVEGLAGTTLGDTLIGNGGANLLLGFEGNDTLDGGDGSDTLDGGAGLDSLTGGLGFDWVDYGSDTFSAVNVNLGSATASADGQGGSDTLTAIEGVIGSVFNDTLTGDGQANTLAGNAGNDTLTGGAGNDTLQGGLGTDTLIGGAGNDVLDGGTIFDLVNLTDLNFASFQAGAIGGATINLQTGVALDGQGGTDQLIDINFVFGTNFNDTITGSSRDIFEQIEGGAGNDVLDGGAINALQTNGNRVSYGNATAAVSVDLATNTATGTATGTDTLLNFNAVRGSAFADTLLGSNSSLTEQFEGRAGNDLIDGRGGFDIARYDAATTGVTASLAAETASDGQGGTDTLLNIEGLRGGAFADLLVGGAAANGSGLIDGQEVFIGGAGNDTINGGAGYDRVDYTSSSSGVVVYLNQLGNGTGFDGFGGVDTLIDIEGVRGSAFDDTLIGSDTSAAIESGNNFESFEGRQGNDTIDGGGGFDRADYSNSAAGVGVNLGTGIASDGHGGTDLLFNIEAVRGSTFGDTLTGSDTPDFATTGLFESFDGNAGNDTIDGRGGMDRVDYQSSTAAVTVNLATGSGSDGMGGTDTLLNIEAVRGSDFNDTIVGSTGANRLNGDLGNDTLTGGAGADVFIFDSALNALTNVDLISDFGAGDLITLDNDVFANLGAVGALGAARFVAGAGVTGASVAGQLAGIYYNTSTGDLYYDTDGFGGASGIKFATVAGAPALTAAAFDVRE